LRPEETLARLRAGQLGGSTRLDLVGAGLTEFPREILALADTLEVLDLSRNALRELPADFGRLGKLRILFASANPFTRLPEAIGACPQLEMVGFKANRIEEVPGSALPPALRWLILTDNRIDELPPELGQRPRLQKLMLAGNALQRLPAEMAACHRLELLRIASNRLAELPPWLLALPRLAWLAYAGNPFAEASENQAVAHYPVADIDWSALTLHEPLGEGASGVIHRATWRDARQAPNAPNANGGAPQNVAVKLFKGAMTSDGSPHSEMDACIAAGAHPSLIAVRGRVVGHPAGTPGLVLQLVDPAFRNLAGPPSLQSCTRDVYAGGTRFSAQTARRIAGGIASAVAQLHSHGILHGDLYAHNILWDEAEHALLGDFGAASFFAPDSGANANALQRIEARAFGCLLEELVERCDRTATVEALAALAGRCLQPAPSARPAFDEIVGVLQAI